MRNLVLALLAFSAPARAAEPVSITEVPVAGRVVLDGIIWKHRVSVRVVTAPVPQWWPAWLEVGGWSLGKPGSHLSELSVSVDGKELYVPKDTHEQLFFVNVARLAPSKHGFVFTVHGSENAEAYTADFAFDFDVMALREWLLTMPSGYGDEERRVYNDGIWQCEREAKASGNVC